MGIKATKKSRRRIGYGAAIVGLRGMGRREVTRRRTTSGSNWSRRGQSVPAGAKEHMIVDSPQQLRIEANPLPCDHCPGETVEQN
jgi:hypothetical protein